MLLARVELLARDPQADPTTPRPTCSGSSSTWCRTPGWPCSPTWCSGRWLSSAATGEAEAHAAAADAVLERYPDAGILRRRAERLRGAVDAARLAEPLTGAEHRVLELLPTHLTEAQMAEQLFVTRNTVKTHVKGVYRKLGVASRAEAVRRAREIGLLPPD